MTLWIEFGWLVADIAAEFLNLSIASRLNENKMMERVTIIHSNSIEFNSSVQDICRAFAFVIDSKCFRFC